MDFPLEGLFFQNAESILGLSSYPHPQPKSLKSTTLNKEFALVKICF